MSSYQVSFNLCLIELLRLNYYNYYSPKKEVWSSRFKCFPELKWENVIFTLKSCAGLLRFYATFYDSISLAEVIDLLIFSFRENQFIKFSQNFKNKASLSDD